ncbi:Glycosylphosphatidylinositol (GPI) anchor assembly protein [Microbotryomycetes sp. JL221]|nr:Glycosylphosphatidylinositol (GPI) anchor assembly protein [Microbotryomycetes sp. JL221]
MFNQQYVTSSQIVEALAQHAVSFLVLLSAMLVVVQASFGHWMRSLRLQAAQNASSRGMQNTASREIQPQLSWTSSFKRALSGKAPRRWANVDKTANKAMLNFDVSSSALSLYGVLAQATAIAVPLSDRYTWLRMFSSVAPASQLEFALLSPALGAVIGCWAGAAPIPLDWDRPWQASLGKAGPSEHVS